MIIRLSDGRAINLDHVVCELPHQAIRGRTVLVMAATVTTLEPVPGGSGGVFPAQQPLTIELDPDARAEYLAKSRAARELLSFPMQERGQTS